MKLHSIRVTNFRSIEDSGTFEVGDLLCLVGKNEAGKSALLQALAGLNPHPATPVSYDLERDYPRRFLTEYAARHKDEQAVVVETTWTLNAAERKAIAADFGEASIGAGPVKLLRRYNQSAPEWELPVDIKGAIQHLMGALNLSPEEQDPLKDASSTPQLRAALNAIQTRTEKQTQLLQKIDALPGQTISNAIIAKLSPLLPKFMYFSHYDRMVGLIRLDTFKAREQNNNPPIERGERVFLDFLEYAGAPIDQILAATTYEGLNARCEGASNHISEQLFEYWRQNQHLAIEVRVTKAERGDPAPYNDGVIARARVRNNIHKLSLPFSERSAGFIWFFSFLVKFAQVKKSGGPLVLLLDEPGLSLHGKAQADLVRYFTEKLVPNHQTIFTTHSPFMVPADRLPLVRIVEDRVVSPRPGVWNSDGTKVRNDVLAVDRDTLFPLQGALGYEITQSLFIGKHTLLVEGPADILYLQALSSALERRKRIKLDPRWTLCPAGGIDKIQGFVALFAAAKLNTAALTDYAKTDKRKLEALKRSQILDSDRILTFAALLGVEEADVEDVFMPPLFCAIVNDAYNLTGTKLLTVQKVEDADKTTTRLLKKVEAAFRVLPPDHPEFDHFRPADWLIRNPTTLDPDEKSVNETLTRAEIIFTALNKLLPLQ